MRSIIKKLGTLIGVRRTLNFIEGSNVTMTIADNPTENRVDITIASEVASSAIVAKAGSVCYYQQLN